MLGLPGVAQFVAGFLQHFRQVVALGQVFQMTLNALADARLISCLSGIGVQQA